MFLQFVIMYCDQKRRKLLTLIGTSPYMKHKDQL
jgi:hypothetical protein